MSGLTLPVDRTSGRAIVIGTASCRASCAGILSRLGYQAVNADDPYLAMAEICQRPLAYRTAALSLASVYREELCFISAIKRRFPHIEVWLAHTDGRPASLAEASRLGADGLLSDEGLHRFALAGPSALIAPPPQPIPVPDQPAPTAAQPDLDPAEPLLSADELKALLDDQPVQTPEEHQA